MMALVTAYNVDSISCGRFAKYNRTSTGKCASRLDGVAAHPRLLPYGTKVHIAGVGTKIVDDTGGFARQARKKGIVALDIRMKDRESALRFGRRWLPVTVLGMVDR